jgi:N-acetyl-anhydromuramyl-L-alanine amidase AmpD
MSGLYPGASWRPIRTNHSAGTAEPNKLFIVHVMQGTLAGTDAWFHNPNAGASSQFGVGNSGTVIQWVSCNQTAWHACNANGKSIGVETEGFTGTPFTDRQVVAIAKLLKWAHREYPDIKLWLNTNPSRGSGLSYHGLGGAAWCNHPACPGSPRVRQLPRILELAKR